MGNPPLPEMAAVIAIPGVRGVVRHRQLQDGHRSEAEDEGPQAPKQSVRARKIKP
jgi:hypothetical protein